MSGSENNWQSRPLGELATTTSGGTPSRKRKDYYGGSIPWVKSGELNDDYIFETEEHITEAGLKNSSAKIFSSGTVLIALYGATVGKTSILRTEASTNQAVCGITPGPDLDAGYLRYHLISLRRELLSHRYGGAQPNISQQIVRNQKIAYPPLPEQKKIAHILSTVQRAIEAQERIIQATTELKKALMHKLFTEGLRNEPRKQTEIGPVPESWEVVRIRTTGTVVTGSTPSTKNAEYYDGDYNLISPADLDNGKYVRSAHKTLTKAGFEKCRTVPRDSVLVGCIGNVGKLGMVADDCSATNQQINSIVPSSNFSPHFLYYALQFCRSRLEQAAAKVTLPILNKSNFENFQIAAPERKEQDAISGHLGILDQKLENAGRKMSQLQDLFRTLLHELMAAKTRVLDFEFTA